MMNRCAPFNPPDFIPIFCLFHPLGYMALVPVITDHFVLFEKSTAISMLDEPLS